MATDLETNKATVREFFGAVEGRDFKAFDQIVVENYAHNIQDMPIGRESLKRYFSALCGAIPDLTMPILDLISEGDTVMVRNQFLLVGKDTRGEFIGSRAAAGPSHLTNSSPLPDTGIVCQQEMTATFCNAPTSPNIGGFGSSRGSTSSAGSGTSSGSGTSAGAGSNTSSISPCGSFPPANELCN